MDTFDGSTVGTGEKSQSDKECLAWLALALTPGLGAKRVVDAVKRIGWASRIFEMTLTEIEGLRFPAGAAQFIFDGKAAEVAEKEWWRVCENGGRVVSLGCREYPSRLREIFDPPPVLWLKGNADLLSQPSIAVVGTRRPSPYGSGIAEMISRDLAVRGVLISSGMARGVDTSAHKGALAAKKPTLAVWGTGIDTVYPKENKKLAEEILATGGAIVSEVPIGTFAAPQNFPRRNRILSGMSIGVLVVEAGGNSGTRITARCALEQDRDVFAIPGNVTNKNSWMPNTLIKQGAKLVATWEDVWEELPTAVRRELSGKVPVESEADVAASLLPNLELRSEEFIVLEVLRSDESLHVDEILNQMETQLTSSEVFTALFELEMAGRIRQLPGKNYVRTL